MQEAVSEPTSGPSAFDYLALRQVNLKCEGAAAFSNFSRQFEEKCGLCSLSG